MQINVSDYHFISGSSFTMTMPIIAAIVSAGTLSVLLNIVLITGTIRLMRRQANLCTRYVITHFIDYFVFNRLHRQYMQVFLISLHIYYATRL